LEIISSAVKIYLKFSNEFETLITDLLTIATENVDNPDVRDRAFIYWRILSTDPEKAKNVVFGKRPPTKDSDKLVDPQFLNEIMKSLGYSNSLFEKLPGELFQKSLAELRGIKLEKEDSSMMGEKDEQP
jgi:AP-1 complex subunit beta-1